MGSIHRTVMSSSHRWSLFGGDGYYVSRRSRRIHRSRTSYCSSHSVEIPDIGSSEESFRQATHSYYERSNRGSSYNSALSTSRDGRSSGRFDSYPRRDAFPRTTPGIRIALSNEYSYDNWYVFYYPSELPQGFDRHECQELGVRTLYFSTDTGDIYINAQEAVNLVHSGRLDGDGKALKARLLGFFVEIEEDETEGQPSSQNALMEREALLDSWTAMRPRGRKT